ncbi:hypothetical protein LPJGGPFB_02656 [Ensifer adhaerens]|uniref:hypothetical protein n=1 Tax=Ensifer adhaerens TaxID=106592 RepID=UPI00156A31CB|nr:hypothetical protein [Ensifer adhaerens]NRP19401.1 hypothetical protein [Ensifer adhaerens]
MGNSYAYALRYFPYIVGVIFVTKTLILDGEDEFDRFTSEIITFFLPVMCVCVVVLTIRDLACGIGKLAPQGRVYKTFSWGAWGSMAAAFTWAIVAAKLTTAS